MRLSDSEPTVAVQVLWRGAELNLNRARDEPVERFLQRLGLNCGKQVEKQGGGDKKRAKKEKKKPSADGQVAEPQAVAVHVPQHHGLPVYVLDSQGAKIPNGTVVVEALRGASHIEIDGERLPVILNPPSVQKLEVFGQPFAGSPLVASMRCEFCKPSAVKLRWLLQATAGGNPIGQCIGVGQVLRVPEDTVGQALTLRADSASTANGTDDSGTGEYGRPMKIVRVGLVEAAPQGWPERRLTAFGPRRSSEVRVVCWNTLAAVYSRSQVATKDMYPYCPPHALDFAYRQPLIGRELERLDGDLVFLQEVSFSTFWKFLMPIFRDRYHSRISLKASKASEGCVLLVRKEAFEILEEKEFLFRNLLRSSAACRSILREVTTKWPDFLHGVLPHMTTIFQVSAVRHTVTGEVVVLANTHLFFHPNARHIRMLQVMCLLLQIQEMRERHRPEGASELPRVILSGDLNADSDTAPVKLLLDGKIPSDHPDWEHASLFSWREDEDALDCDDEEGNAQASRATSAPSMEVEAGDEVLPLPQEEWQTGRGVALESPAGALANAYAEAPLPFSNYVNGFNATLDWIVTAGRFRVVRTLGGASEEDLAPHGGLPSVLYPSDHLSIAVDLQFDGLSAAPA